MYYTKLPNSHDSQSASGYTGRIETTTEFVLRCLVVDPLPNFITMRASLPQKTHAEGHIDARTSFVLETLKVVERDKKYSACFEDKVRYCVQQLASEP